MNLPGIAKAGDAAKHGLSPDTMPVMANIEILRHDRSSAKIDVGAQTDSA